MAIWRSGAVLVSIVVFGLVAGCKQRVKFAREGLEEKVAKRMEAVIARPAVDKAFDEFMAALASDQALQSAGVSLAGKLSADPQIAAAVEEFMESVQSLPAMQAAVRDLMARNPDASVDQI